jgi:hypothetical protein
MLGLVGPGHDSLAENDVDPELLEAFENCVESEAILRRRDEATAYWLCASRRGRGASDACVSEVG